VELWEAQILSYLTYLDMEQDSRFSMIDLFNLKENLMSYDLDYTKEMTQSKSMQIARDRLSNYFINAEIDRKDGLVVFSPKVSDTNTGKVFFEGEYNGESIYELVDEFTVQLNQKIYPDKDSQFSFVDNPANEIISVNDDVVKIYVQNLYETTQNPQLSPAILQAISKTVELDESCALCYEQLANNQVFLNIEGSSETYSEALKHADALPEKLQYRIRLQNYMVKTDVEKAVKVAERWSALYPFDMEPYRFLIRYHLSGFRFDDAKDMYRTALDKGHKSFLLDLANLQIANEEYDDAMHSIEEYKKVFPHKAADLLEVGDIYIKQGKLTEATEFYENILVSDPSNIDAALKTADAFGRIGNPEEEMKILNEALEFAKTPMDSVLLMDGFKANYLRFGNESKFMELVNAQNELNKSNFAPIQGIMADITSNTLHYVRFNNVKHVEYLFSTAQNMADAAQKPMLECICDFNIGFWTGNKMRLERSLVNCEDMLKGVLGKGGEHQIDGVLAGANGDYDGAIDLFKKFAEESGGNFNLLWQLVIDYYVNGERYDEGLKLMDKVLLSDPQNPIAQLYRAKCGFKLNQVDQSKKYLSNALNTWEAASPNYIYFKEAIALANEMSL